ncbi:type II toxin-antitoxin system PemK/MazF family toxin [Aureimonas sp. AU20]|uniref:type II toxin-antitoxin system PemK/MazF family toxin n=2 Tax=Aureimonas sp. AU20 TaxID=1349819 RepID=UPI00178CDD21
MKFLPQRGAIVVCDYSTGFQPPEMVKRRLAVVVSPKLPNRDNLCAVIPLSTTPPKAGVTYQCRVRMPADPPAPFEGTEKWAKADMLATVSCHRLDFLRIGVDRTTGQRIYYRHTLAAEEMRKIEAALLAGLGLDHLTPKG